MPTRKTTSLTKKRIEQEQAFERTRENMSEFGRAGTANRLLRSALKPILVKVADRYVSGRLTKRMMCIIQSDPVNGRGERIISAQALSMLEGFNFNRNKSLNDTLYATYHISYDRVTGLATIQIPFFNATAMVDTASGADSYSFIACALAIDFTHQQVEYAHQQTDIITVNNTTTKSIHISLSLPAGNIHPVIITLGVEFYDLNDDHKHVIINKACNAMAVVKVITT